MAGELGCHFYYSDMIEQCRREVQEAWAAGGSHRWITVTTGLGTGIDVEGEGIVAVVHMGQLYWRVPVHIHDFEFLLEQCVLAEDDAGCWNIARRKPPGCAKNGVKTAWARRELLFAL